ncbi:MULTISPECIES: exonuclease SbcCD subunit D [unclassified Arthrobacter]|uniref:exonuclease SbcCD subunit D n=1 Tax=unclassified Arthrobacter TaxID=235627 RepID=UPI0014910842|nr:MULTISPECIES: exonuclease SbcCD subunit D [unclassified Arthrobacter]MBE0010472.1 exonuclease SbcCD subunit D [Arthrobacter sp. AET 35A]NOJ62368.1 exonuclease SbcCD subunit D [Arthrobacter sp. 147(2020)]
MRLLHTSDWHLGRSFHGVGTLQSQRLFIDHLEKSVREFEVDVVLIAGDVYDRALPSVDVVGLFDEALERLTAAGAQVVVSSGNHDSATRLGFGGRILERGGVHLRTRLEDIARPVIFPLDDDGAELAVYGLPYLEPRLVAETLGAEAPSHTAVTRAALDLVRSDLAHRRSAGPVRSLVMAHTFASGGITSDSERDLSVGGVGAVPLDLFETFDYAALGHLHGQQQLATNVRYSGSPLPYSFSEARQSKGAWLVEIGPEGLGDVRAVEWPGYRELAVLTGELEELLSDPRHEWAETAYCHITLVDPDRPSHAMERLRSRFPSTLVLVFEPLGDRQSAAQTYSQRIAKATDDVDVCCGFLDHVRSRPASESERTVLASVLETVRSAEVER